MVRKKNIPFKDLLNGKNHLTEIIGTVISKSMNKNMTKS